ncbi:MAG: hypothetical protein ACQKBT_08425 [Puniceicoccales bacterium]
MKISERIQVAQFGLGPIGILSLKLLAQKKWVKVVGGIDIRPEWIGKSLSEITGEPDSFGDAIVYGSFEELLNATGVDAVVHTVTSKADQAFAQIRPMMEHGIAVISSCEELIFPSLREPKMTREIDDLCQTTGGRLLGCGFNPSYVFDILPICLSGVCSTVKGIYCERVVDASTRRGPLHKKLGCGLEPDDFRTLAAQGKAGHAGLQESLALIANSLGWKIGTIIESIDPVIADRDIQSNLITVNRGQTAGLQQTVKAETNEGYWIHFDLVSYLNSDDNHNLVQLNSSPQIEAIVFEGIAGDIATGAALVNTIPSALRAKPGVRLLTDIGTPYWHNILGTNPAIASKTTQETVKSIQN